MDNGTYSIGRLLSEGLVSQPDAVAQVSEFVDFSHSGRGSRVIDIRLSGGLSFEVLPDRGLDIGAVWWRGAPEAWRSPLLSESSGEKSWDDRFRGGLVTTCGLENIGPPTASAGQHGSHSSTPATEVRWWREAGEHDVTVHVAGTVGSFSFADRRVVLRREITASTGRAGLEIRDTIVNEGRTDAAVPVLYHVNFGAPFLLPGSAVGVAADSVVARDASVHVPSSERMPDPADPVTTEVFEHLGVASVGGRSRATLDSPVDRARATLEWPSATLPRLYQWVWPTRGNWVLAIEPANAPLFGDDRSGAHLGAPVLAPGESTETGVRIGFEER